MTKEGKCSLVFPNMPTIAAVLTIWQNNLICQVFIALDRTHTIFSPAGIDRGCWVISGFGHHLGLTDTLVHLVSMSCWYRSGARQDEFRLSQAALSCEFQKYDVMTMSEVGGQPKKKIPSYKATKRKRTFLIFDYCGAKNGPFSRNTFCYN